MAHSSDHLLPQLALSMAPYCPQDKPFPDFLREGCFRMIFKALQNLVWGPFLLLISHASNILATMKYWLFPKHSKFFHILFLTCFLFQKCPLLLYASKIYLECHHLQEALTDTQAGLGACSTLPQRSTLTSFTQWGSCPSPKFHETLKVKTKCSVVGPAIRNLNAYLLTK